MFVDFDQQQTDELLSTHTVYVIRKVKLPTSF